MSLVQTHWTQVYAARCTIIPSSARVSNMHTNVRRRNGSSSILSRSGEIHTAQEAEKFTPLWIVSRSGEIQILRDIHSYTSLSSYVSFVYRRHTHVMCVDHIYDCSVTDNEDDVSQMMHLNQKIEKCHAILS